MSASTFTPTASSATVFTPIVDLKPFMKSVNLRMIVVSKLETNITKDGHRVYSFITADQSGSIILSLWDEIGGAVKSADILQILGGFVMLYKGYIRLACKVGSVTRMGRYCAAALFVGSFCMLFKEEPNMSLVIWTPDPADEKVLLPRHPKKALKEARQKGKRLPKLKK